MNLGVAHPWALLLLPLAPLVVWLSRRPSPAAVAWPGAAELQRFADRIPGRARAIALTAAFLCGVGTLSGLRRELPGDPLADSGVAIMLVVDVSGSMAEPDFPWGDTTIPRLEAVKRSLREFIARRPTDRLGLILFATQPEVVCPLTRDHAALLRRLDEATPRGVPTESETNLGDAVAWGLARLREERGRRLMAVFSDGEHNVPAPALTPRQAGQLAGAADVPVTTVFTGPHDGPGRTGIASLARLSEGETFVADDADALAHVNEAIDHWEKREAVDPRRRRYAEYSPWLALAAAVIMSAWLAYDRGPGLTIP